MAEVNPPGFLQNAGNVHTAEVTRNSLAMLTGRLAAPSMKTQGGVHPDLGGFLDVDAAGTPNMSVDIASGVAFIPGTEGAKQGVYTCVNDATVNKTIATSDPALPRIDLVVAKVEDSFYSGGTNAWSLAVVTGTPAGSPTVPAAPSNSIALAQVAVGAGVTSITNANITERRTYAAGLRGIIKCTSTTRPTWMGTVAGLGQPIFETDTDLVYVWNGTTWRLIGPQGNADAMNVVAASDTTTSATYVNLAGTSSIVFNKLFTPTRLKIDFHASCFITLAVNTEVRFAVRVNSVDYDIAGYLINPTSQHMHFSGTVIVPAGVPSGNQTVQGRWRRVAGTGQLNRGTDDRISIGVVEIIP
jgi:hypothetical protein